MAFEQAFREGDIEFAINKCSLHGFDFKCPVCGEYTDEARIEQYEAFGINYRDYSDDSIIMSSQTMVCFSCGIKCRYSIKRFKQIVCILKMKGKFK